MSLKQKLQLYKKQLHEAQQAERSTPEKNDGSESVVAAEERLAVCHAARELDATLRQWKDQYVLVHSETLPLTSQTGLYPFSELFEAVAAWQQGPDAHPLSAHGLKATDLLFFDTETTGLSSGAGQMIFLIGLARVTSGGVELRQYFLPGPGHETAFYDAFLRDTQSLKNLVTFNGKAYDWPRVKTRHQFVREHVPRLPQFGHFDLLHAARRLWKRRLDSVGLQKIEQTILKMGRSEDVPGKMAPFLYFQFLKNPQASLVKGILEHNREDVLTLIILYCHLSFKILGLATPDTEESFEIARWFDQIKAKNYAQPLFERLAAAGSDYSVEAKAYLARYAKQKGNFDQALSLLREVIRSGSANDSHYIQAAKLLEHQFKNNRQALLYTQQAIALMNHWQGKSERFSTAKLNAYRERLNRLDTKLLNNRN
ncbi:ribonuclease H-like domain-containing protein [Sporolactobacillus spathodeae]|uniref:Uncharacterized protein YprB with RNaseH-like and TPR domain n=1 Tax=Sporolactobacillus spathodeae TaxID=1465502 RepID=A0ABS2Q9U2_9BACL|nr:ribonuclease H-like domain-containing protein [Sporolactobacillus spathodeae]MBM7657939.1 uncharacterized protein YprB with RNaseH-like and TPR domain [Sporolactobacillus spathodeae]